MKNVLYFFHGVVRLETNLATIGTQNQFNYYRDLKMELGDANENGQE